MLLTVDDYPAVRASLNIALTADELPDATIALPVFAGQAERRVRAQVLDWDALDADGLELARMAAVYWCASLLALRLPNVVMEKRGAATTQVQPQDLKALAEELEDQALDTLRALPVGVQVVVAAPTLFTVAPACRGY